MVLIVFHAHLRNSIVVTLIQMNNIRKMHAKCLLILPVKMIYNFMELVKVAGVMHEADHAYSSQSTW